MKLSRIILLFLVLFNAGYSFSQSNFVRITAFTGVSHQLVTFTKNETIYNFSGFYSVGFPVGLIFWKTADFGFSVELTPTLRAENGNSRMSNLLFHPGVVFKLKNDFRFFGRAAFETSGRYGFTPIISKTFYRAKDYSFYASLSSPFRFGNSADPSMGLAVQVGIVF